MLVNPTQIWSKIYDPIHKQIKNQMDVDSLVWWTIYGNTFRKIKFDFDIIKSRIEFNLVNYEDYIKKY